uniref:Uncharacterized protein n=1 Tax=Arundo donax TaxID=35708 RepID=A0A0A9FGP3_ARUDO
MYVLTRKPYSTTDLEIEHTHAKGVDTNCSSSGHNSTMLHALSSPTPSLCGFRPIK